MPRLVPVSWREMVSRLREFGFEGPLVGGKHPYMLRGDLVLTLPNPHEKDVGVDLLRRILRNAGISPDDWLSKP